jgi:hypothetical protein
MKSKEARPGTGGPWNSLTLCQWAIPVQRLRKTTRPASVLAEIIMKPKERVLNQAGNDH